MPQLQFKEINSGGRKISLKNLPLKQMLGALAGAAQWIECWPMKERGRCLDSQSGHMPGLRGPGPQ